MTRRQHLQARYYPANRCAAISDGYQIVAGERRWRARNVHNCTTASHRAHFLMIQKRSNCAAVKLFAS